MPQFPHYAPSPRWFDHRLILMVIMGGLGGVLASLHFNWDGLIMEALSGTIGATIACALYAFTVPAVTYSKRPRAPDRARARENRK